ncbi:MAG: ATP-grasp domain-containing protein [Candidatus Ancillula sp.]|jgi:acetyl-CoA/propionyl-CoA carboxylase biotin carboxyl carrier protein|nr:ATP-grasp domain-containing protein [Candidatus Ancillula sp.]
MVGAGQSLKKIDKVLIANRGEIAVRVIRTCRDLGISSVAVYSDEDRNAQFVELADEAYSLNGTGFQDTYMNPDKICEIILRTNAKAVHPGYGFLSENSDFARRVANLVVKDVNGKDINVSWLGPSGDAIEALGDKVKARKVAEKANVNPVPGLSDFLDSEDTVRSFIKQHGFPAILKRADGGGGHGITVVRNESDLDNFLIAHSHDINFYFIERFVENARHVETQSARDRLGNFSVVSTRDCSLQRRNQKLLEEAPAPFLNPEIENQIRVWSKALFETVNYEGLGTCEFLLENLGEGEQALYFLEVNPRLQVEHTVSEEVSGVDLVEQQIRIAEGLPLDKKLLVSDQVNTDVNGDQIHSIELRITSENPYTGMTPTAGVISKLNWPMGPGVRLEPGIKLGDQVTTDFDSMVAKIIVTGKNRSECIARTKRALKEFEIVGISTPKDLFNVILSRPEFVSTTKEGFTVSTKWLENVILPEFDKKAGELEFSGEGSNNKSSSQSSNKSNAESQINSAEETTEYSTFVVEIDGKRSTLKLPDTLLNTSGSSQSSLGNVNQAGRWGRTSSNRLANGRMSSILGRRGVGSDSLTAGQSSVVSADPSKIVSPMQGIVVRVCVDRGQEVKAGDLVVVLEAMKMEKFVTAEADGVVQEIHVVAKDSVQTGQLLVSLEDVK